MSSNSSNDDPGNQPTGYIAKGLDPVGNVLGKGLSPVGAVVGAVTKPLTDTVGKATKPVLGAVAGTQDERAEVVGGNKTAADFKSPKEKQEAEQFGGKEQTGDNPLGL